MVQELNQKCWICAAVDVSASTFCDNCVAALKRLNRTPRGKSRLELAEPFTSIQIHEVDVFKRALTSTEKSRLAVDVFFYGWFLNSAESQDQSGVSLNASNIQNLINKLPQSKDAARNFVVKLSHQVDTEFANPVVEFEKTVACVARALEVCDQLELALETLMRHARLFGKLLPVSSYQMARIIASTPIEQIWPIISDEMELWGGNWQIGVKNKDALLIITILCTRSLDENPVFFYLIKNNPDFDSYHPNLDKLMDAQREAFIRRMEWHCSCIEGKIQQMKEIYERTEQSFYWRWIASKPGIRASALNILNSCKTNTMVKKIEAICADEELDYVKLRTGEFLSKQAVQWFDHQYEIFGNRINGVGKG